MTDQQDGSIIRHESSSLSKAAPLGNPLVSRMAGDVLSRVNSIQITQERVQLGDYSFRPPDYRQIMRWAETFGLDPIELLGVFEKSGYLEVADGAILSLRWDLKKLPFPGNDWEYGILITDLYIVGSYSKEQSGRLCITGENLPNLANLTLRGLNGIAAEISRLPKLEWLSCCNCKLPALTLRLDDFPGLRGLELERNELKQSDFSFLPDMLHLWHTENRLTEINLMHFPGLKTLNLRGNQIKNLDLSPTPLLTELNCSNNQLKELDLSQTPLLNELDCSNNQLNELDLSSTQLLIELNCSNNQLKELDLEPTSSLASLICSANQIVKLDISQSPRCDTPNNESDLVDPPYFSCEENPLEKIVLTNNQYLKLSGKIPNGAMVEVAFSANMVSGLDA